MDDQTCERQKVFGIQTCKKGKVGCVGGQICES